jgi:Lar family restriction alleviation protein
MTTDLIKRLTEAGEGSRKLDAEFHYIIACRPNKIAKMFCLTEKGDVGHWVPHYTTNLQDAVSAVPDGYIIDRMGHDAAGTLGTLKPLGATAEIINGVARRQGQAATMPLALCIAALKALEAKDEEDMTEHTPLLPCPFCGSAVSMSRDRLGNDEQTECYQVECDCGAVAGAWRTRKQDAISDWNRRSPALLARVLELEAERDAANARAGAIPSEAEICDIIARNCDDTQVDLLGSARAIIANIRALREAGK